MYKLCVWCVIDELKVEYLVFWYFKYKSMQDNSQ